MKHIEFLGESQQPEANDEMKEEFVGSAAVIRLTAVPEHVVRITEKVGNSEVELSKDDYTQLRDHRSLLRTADGSHPSLYWNGRVSVTYVPALGARARYRSDRRGAA